MSTTRYALRKNYDGYFITENGNVIRPHDRNLGRTLAALRLLQRKEKLDSRTSLITSLRARGLTFDEIAKEAGCSLTTAWKTAANVEVCV